jgi:hypothetical protein
MAAAAGCDQRFECRGAVMSLNACQAYLVSHNKPNTPVASIANGKRFSNIRNHLLPYPKKKPALPWGAFGRVKTGRAAAHITQCRRRESPIW